VVNECRFFSRLTLIAMLITACGTLSGIGKDAPPSHPTSSEGSLYHDVSWVRYDASIFDKAEEQHKLVLVYLNSQWCPGCSAMRVHFAHPDVVRFVNENFIPVITDEDGETVKESLELSVYPSVVVFGPRGERLVVIEGYVSMSILMVYLRRAVRDADWTR
jgi:hypothetical protein